MASNRLTTYHITLFNLIMAILLFITSELILLSISGYKVVNVATSIEYEYPLNPSGTPIPTALPYSIPNYPVMIIIITLIVNTCFYYRLKKQASTLQN